MPEPATRLRGSEGEYYYVPAEPLDFSSALAPGGDDWATFLTNVYRDSASGRETGYSLYWPELYPVIARGTAYWIDPDTGQLPRGVAPPHPNFLAAANQAPAGVYEAAQSNLRAIQDTSVGSPFGDNFFTAVLGLGLAGGAAAAFGGFAPAAASGAGALTPAADIAPVAASPGLTAPTAVGGGAVAGGGGSAAVLGGGGAAATGGAGLTVTGPAAAAVGATPSATAATGAGILGTGLTLGDAARLGGAALSVGSTLAGASGPERRTTSNVVFPPETRALIGGVEFPLTASARDEQSATVGPLLSGSAFRPEIGARYGAARATDTIRSSVARGARRAGITDLGPAFEDTNVLMPQLTSSLRELALQRGAQNTTAVAPGLQPFLAPSTSQRTTGGGPSALETGFSLASTLGSAYLSTL